MRGLYLSVAAAGLLAACEPPSGPKVTFNRPPNAEDVAVEFCSGGPSWIAVKEDGMDWQPFPFSLNSFNKFTIPVTPRVGIAYGYAIALLPGYSEVHVLYLTANELKTATCGPPRGTLQLIASISGIQPTDFVNLRAGASSGTNYLSGSTVSVSGVGSGPQDFVGTVAAQTFGANISKMIVRHSFLVASGQSFPPLKFDSSEAITPTPVKMVAPGADSSAFNVSSGSFITNLGVVQPLWVVGSYPTDSDVVFMPAPSQVASGDGFAVKGSVGGRIATKYFASPTPQTFQLGPALATPTLTLLQSSPVLRYHLSLPSQPEYPTLVRFSVGEVLGRSFTVTATAAYLGGTPATSWEIDMPDFSKLIVNDLLLVGPASKYAQHVEAWDTPIAQFFSPYGASDGLVVKCATWTPSSVGPVVALPCAPPYGFIRY